MEDQINRGLRTSLVFRDIPKTNTENTWDDTANVLAESINRHCKVLSKKDIISKIERVHRGKANNYNKPPIIIAKFLSWKDSELIKNAIITQNKTHRDDKSSHLNVSPMYSKATTERNNAALKRRKLLMAENPEEDFIVVYPAKIVSRKKNTRNKYTVAEEY